MNPEAITKSCSTCGNMKPLVDFARDRSQFGGYGSRCKECERERRAKYCAAHPERVRAAAKKSYFKHWDRSRERNKNWIATNKPRVNKSRRARRRLNPGAEKKFAPLKVRYRQQNLEKYAAYAANRRALKFNATAGDQSLVTAFYAHVHKSQRVACYWCGKRVPKGKRHVDHIIPLTKGGLHEVNNLCSSCATCNVRKNAMLPDEFTGQGVLL